MSSLPGRADTVIIGAGIHGLSTAYHLAQVRPGKKIVVLDKNGIGAGASGIACGVIRNNYFQPAMRELMAHSVAIWESDPKALHYHPVGYMQISCESMHEDIAQIHQEQQAIGYESVFIEGKSQCTTYMKGFFSDWQAKGITTVLHERKGGYSNNTLALAGLQAKAEALGVEIVTGVEVIGFLADSQNTVTAVKTSMGSVAASQFVIAAGPWSPRFWEMLGLADTVSVKNPDDGSITDNIPMWIYWSLQEGTLGVDPKLQVTNDGALPPVIHVDTDAALYSDLDGATITEDPWGIYYKPDFHFNGVQGGAAPFIVDKPAGDVAVDPYGPASPEFIVGEDFRNMWVSALAHCQKRFEGTMPYYNKEPSGGIGAFTPDSFPVFDRVRDNCYLIADSNHGWKMIGIGKLVAEELNGATSQLLEPFRFSRFAEGRLHPISNSPFPWS